MNHSALCACNGFGPVEDSLCTCGAYAFTRPATVADVRRIVKEELDKCFPTPNTESLPTIELLKEIERLRAGIQNSLRVLNEDGHQNCPWCSHARYPLQHALGSQSAGESKL